MDAHPNIQSLPAAWRIPVENGFSVFPVELRGKTPLGPWKEYQTQPASLKTVCQWAERPSNVGIATGAVSGLVVLDLDSDQAVQEAKRRGLPHTVTVSTGKGLHAYFRHPGGTVGNRSGILPGWDIRGDGGYVVAPGSVHPSGVVYSWENAHDAAPLADMPDWLNELLAKPAAVAVPPQPRTGNAYGEKAIDNEMAALRRAPQGQRNDQLNKSAFSLGQLAGGGVIDSESARRCLRGVAMAIGLGSDEIQKTLDSGWAAGFAKPRTPEVVQTWPDVEQGAQDYDPVTGELEPDELPIEPLDLGALAVTAPTRKQFIIPKIGPAGEVTLCTGPGGSGKSLLGQQLATAIAAGVPTLGLEMGQATAIYLTCEDDPEQLHWRQDHICRALGVSMADLKGKLWLASLRGRLDNALGMIDSKGDFAPSRAYHRLADFIRRSGAKLVFLDNLSHLFTGDENNRGEVTRFANALNRLAGKSGAAIVLLGHTNKAFLRGDKQGNSHSGSTAWINSVRSQFTVEHDPDTDLRTLTVGKANYSRTGETMRFAWHEWAFVREEDLSAEARRTMLEAMQASTDDKLFLDCLRLRNGQQRAVSEKQCATYAPNVFATMPESKGIGKPRLIKAMERLFRVDAIERGELWKGDDRKSVRGLREAGRGAMGESLPRQKQSL